MLTDWLKQRAGQFDQRDLARTYVVVKAGEPAVLGYYALSNHRVSFDALPPDQSKGPPRLDVPVILLGRLAVDRAAQERGLGSHLLIDALRRARNLAEHIGVRAVKVDAIDEEARRFYLKIGFTALLDDPKHLLIPMHVVRKLDLPPFEA